MKFNESTRKKGKKAGSGKKNESKEKINRWHDG